MLQVSGISVKLSGKCILDSITFGVENHEIVAIVGKSGVGKTTLLKAMAGLIAACQGSITLNGELIIQPSNNIGLVFQEYFVFPWLNVENNVLLGLEYGNCKLSGEDMTKKVHGLLKSTDLLEHKKKYPSQLSGGMCQRVAFCRALANNPEILLLDEPFGALDLITRVNLHSLIKSIFDNNRQQSIIMVTHNINEAIALADRIILLTGTPASIANTWQIDKPRADSFLTLTPEKSSILNQILTELKN